MVGALLAEEGASAAAAGSNWFVHHAYVITLLPFISGALTLFFGKRTPGKGPVYGILAIGAGLFLVARRAVELRAAAAGTSSRTSSGSRSGRCTCSSASTSTA